MRLKSLLPAGSSSLHLKLLVPLARDPRMRETYPFVE